MFARRPVFSLHLVIWTATLALCLTFASTTFAEDSEDTSAPTCADDEIFDPVPGDCRYTFSIRYTSRDTLPAMIEACEERESMLACASWSVWAWRRGGWEKVSERAGQLCEERCNAGDPAGCGCLAHLVGTGSAGFERDRQRGSDLAQQSCAGGVGWGCNMARTLHNDTVSSDRERRVDDALRTYERGCLLGDPSSCANLGFFAGHTTRGGDTLTEHIARTYFQEGCEKHIGWACGVYGEMLYLGMGGDTNVEEGIAFNRRGCALGDPMSCKRLGDLYLGSTELSLPSDYQLALEYFGYACDSRDARACHLWATIADLAFPDLEPPTRLEEAYKIACFRGRSESCVALSNLYLSARKDWPAQPEAARSPLERSCRRHADDSCVAYGHLVEQGIGGEVDLNVALEAYERACQNGEPKGCQWAGALVMHEEPERAFEIFTEGCDRGVGNSCNWLALWLETHASPEDQRYILGLHQRACDLDEPRGCFDLALIYETGRGEFEANPPLAMKHMAGACRLNDPIACVHLGRYLLDGVNNNLSWDERAVPLLTSICVNALPHRRDMHRASTLSCRWLAQSHADRGLHSQALDIAQRGCDLRDADSCALAAELLKAENFEPVTRHDATTYEAKACDYGDLSYCSDVTDGQTE
ncbi:sel1 repeat family protein [Bradymonadaceae bacterium TMQ3]|nr:sel1 repeat family protein [Bradymonadaceae bacterium TMQ3]TXC75494.1 sel1 repeat family protein [Bradymonadales bacterium TMQ1]